jgi:hypothetical protein
MANKWKNRLTVDVQEHAEVLVLKTKFNTAWNYFNASKLGDTILGYWRLFMDNAENGISYNNNLDLSPAFIYRPGTFGPKAEEFMTPVTLLGGPPASLPDIRIIGILNRRTIVSRKRTRNLFDLTNLWKRQVFSSLDRVVQDDVASSIKDPNSMTLDVTRYVPDIAISSQRADRPQPGDLEYNYVSLDSYVKAGTYAPLRRLAKPGKVRSADASLGPGPEEAEGSSSVKRRRL